MTGRIKIIYTEDQALARKNLIALLKQNEIDCIGEASNGSELLKLLERGLIPDVILLDLQMPKMDGNTVLNILKKDYPYIKVVVLTSFEDVALRNDFMKKGVNAFITKSVEILEIVEEIRKVHHSESYRNTIPEGKSMFRKREIQMIPLISKGFTNKQIAAILNLKEKSVESAKKRLYEKTNCKNLAEFVTFCTEEGLRYLGSPLALK